MALLDLQSSLHSEIQAKEAIREELRNAKAQQIVTENKLQEALSRVEEQSTEIARLQAELSSARAPLGSGCESPQPLTSPSGVPLTFIPHSLAVFDRPDSQSSFYRFLFNDAAKLEDVSGDSPLCLFISFNFFVLLHICIFPLVSRLFSVIHFHICLAHFVCSMSGAYLSSHATHLMI